MSGRGGCCSILLVGGWIFRGTGRGERLGLGLGGWIGGLVEMVSLLNKLRGGGGGGGGGRTIYHAKA